ncbi:hypothetical protein M408DRAFT_307148 [Serendipita vermifera MAFF 305830]|uniref:Rap-GAP domain-containing protein n=1 Tax=Serendipita vermifera MAFF 305830 TaxID=933852 RepID=A0A0C3A7D1_SERVB|nr:hypothetical protein M408DRAFT_307148 [Serendipita vermifera MAFF 305830]
MSKHLHDYDLLIAIEASKERASPVHGDWGDYFKRFMEIYRENSEGYPASRRAILALIEAEHFTLVDIAVFHNEISEALVILLEETLPQTRDEQLLQAVSRILHQELLVTIGGETRMSENASSSGTRDPHLGLSSCSHHIIAVNFLINAFSEMIFTNAKAPCVSVTNSGSDQASMVSKFALVIFQTLLDLMGSKVRRLSIPRISCMKARLAVLQWMLRLRADCDHRVFICIGDIPGVISLAQLARRAESSTALFWEHNDVDFNLKARKRRKAAFSNSLEGASSAHTPSSYKDDSESTRKRYIWQIPDQILVDATDEMTRPSPAITTCAGAELEGTYLKLSVHQYLSAIIGILANSRNWGIVSYILCHLPAQLSNRRLFYGRDTNRSLRRLVIGVCNWIKNDALYERLRGIRPHDLPRSAVQAILYHCLTVLLSYHNWLEPIEGEVNGDIMLNYMIVESLVNGLSGGEMTRRPCLEALSIAIYRVPEEVSKFSSLIIEKLSTLATNPLSSLQIVEYLLIAGYTPRIHVGVFRDDDYQRVFGIPLMYIQQRSRADADTITTLEGKESYSLAQHVYRTSFTIFYVWIGSMKLADRARFAPFISNGLREANNGQEMNASSKICLDWLEQYTHSTVDSFPWSDFMYSSIAIPGYRREIENRATGWEERKKLEMENSTAFKAWKMGNTIILAHVIKEPVGWARLVFYRPSSRVDLYCHVEGLRYCDSVENYPETGEHHDCTSSESTVLEGAQVRSETHGNVFALDQSNPSDTASAAMHPMLIPSIFNDSIIPQNSSLPTYPDFEKLKRTLSVLGQYPVINPHLVGILYVGPGQTKEEEILANTHGSLTYSHFVSRIGQLVDLNAPDNFYARGLHAGSHGRYTIAWVDDVSSINFHVATMMPNTKDNIAKKGAIGNDSVKIIWNDGGRPYEFSTFRSQFNLINIVVEPQSSALTSAYRASIDGFLRVTLQTGPGMPRLTPIGDFKNVRLDYLPDMLRHCTLLACLFCESWMSTGMDGPTRNPLETNWRSRLACIERSERYLKMETD